MPRFLFYIILGCAAVLAEGQENHFAQFYSTPQYLNPAFAGDGKQARAGSTFRLMSPTDETNILNSLVHFDYKIPHQPNGIGVFLYQHTEALTHLKLQVNYSHSIQLNEKSWVKGGLAISFNQRHTPSQSLKYPDQYNNSGYTGQASAEQNLKENSYFPAVAAGIILYNHQTWMSLSADYLNQPKENFAGASSTYPTKLCFMMGSFIPINKTSSRRRINKMGDLKPISGIGPLAGFTWQNKYLEASAGISLFAKPIFVAINYRYQHNLALETTQNAYKAMVWVVGIRQPGYSLTYSYDQLMGSLTSNKSKAHEFSLVFYFEGTRRDIEPVKLVPLPAQLIYD